MRIVAAALAVCVACSSHYIPRSRGRVAITVVDGRQVYIRDGRMYPIGLLGGGLADAVAGNPAAVAAAHQYHDRLRDGVVQVLLGTAAFVGGFTYAAVEAANQSPNSTRVDGVPLAIAAVGLAVMLWGTGSLATADPLRWDAINIFNDAADVAPPGPPGYAATTPATSPLRMRD